MSDIKSKALNSTIWSFLETIGSQGIQFILGIILARILSPEDYGLVAIISVFIGFSTVIIDGGFKTSIIRTSRITINDTSTIFWYNVIVSFSVGVLLFILSHSIAAFFHKPQLELIIKVFAIVPFINSLGVVHNALLFKSLQIKLNTKIILISNVSSGIIAVILALNGLEYWSLVIKVIIQNSIYTILLWVFNNWRPKVTFSLISFRNHFKFGSNLLIVGLIDTTFDQIYSLIIGKFYSFRELGLYNRGNGYVDLFSKSLSSAIIKVNSSILALIKSSNSDLIEPHRKIVSNSAFIIYPLCLGLAAVASPLIITLIGEKWTGSVIFLQLLAFARLAYPIINSGASVLEVLGRSDLNLKYTIINRSILSVIIILSFRFGIFALILGNIIHSLISAFLIMFIISRTIKLKISVQILDIARILGPALIMAGLVYLYGYILAPFVAPLYILISSVFFGVILYYFLAQKLKLKEINIAKEALNILFKKIKFDKYITIRK